MKVPKNTAVTPGDTSHRTLDPMASRFVDVDGLAWEETRFPGIRTKTLLVDPQTGLLTVLMQCDPGARLPDHEHVLIEQTYVLEGSLHCAEGVCTAGNFVWRPSGTRHEAWCPEGALMLAMFQAPNRFYEAGGVKDMLDRDWESTWGASPVVRALRGD